MKALLDLKQKQDDQSKIGGDVNASKDAMESSNRRKSINRQIFNRSLILKAEKDSLNSKQNGSTSCINGVKSENSTSVKSSDSSTSCIIKNENQRIDNQFEIKHEFDDNFKSLAEIDDKNDLQELSIVNHHSKPVGITESVQNCNGTRR